MTKTLHLHDKTYEQLEAQKTAESNTFDQVIRRLLDQAGATTPAEHSSPPEADAETEQLAEATLTLGDLHTVDQEDISAATYLQQEYGVTPAEYESETDLLAAVREARS
jgi:predicted CopG family antitoxin